VRELSEIEFVSKLHKVFVEGAKACEEYMNAQQPEEPKNAFDKLKWEHVESRSDLGPYEQAKDDGSEVFKILRDTLSEHDGFWSNDKHKYWFHGDHLDMVDRRAKA